MNTSDRERTIPDFEDDLELGEWLYRELVASFGLETEAWAVTQVGRVERQLQVKRAPKMRMTPVVLWLQEMTAFTTPGRYIYISRELLQRTASDDPVAFVLAHEMAHHDLGHLDLFHDRFVKLRHLPGGIATLMIMRFVERMVLGPEAEAAADRYAFDLCRAAGYDAHRCLEAFDILEAYAIDHRDLDIVFGPETSFDTSASPLKAWLAKTKTWGWERVRGYLPIRERKEALVSLL